ncbi:MAG: radical SAM protein [Anaerolineae bacterium]
MRQVRLIPKKTSTLHDFPYAHERRKCFHAWIINVTPPGYDHCIHRCTFCYAREAIYSRASGGVTQIYSNLPELVEADLKRLRLCPPISLSNTTDPCQDIPELRLEVKRLVRLIMDYGASFAIHTKGDPSFLLDLDGFAEYERKFVAVSIEGPPDVVALLSPNAPSFEKRIEVVQKLSGLGVKVVVRFDPAFVHLFRAIYGVHWEEEIENLIDLFARSGSMHVVSSTGRLSRKRAPGRLSLQERIYRLICAASPALAEEFLADYRYDDTYTSKGYLLRHDLRLSFHRLLRGFCEARGMTYATCQETHAWETDSEGLPHCEAMPLPFTVKGADGRFHPIEGCAANCHVSCRGVPFPPCGRPELAVPEPFKRRWLK